MAQIILYVGIFCFSSPVFGQPESLTTADFSLTLPTDFIYEKPNDKEVVLLGRPPMGGYPTFNIIRVPGDFDLKRSVKRQLAEIQNSYQLAGLVDPRAEAIEIKHIISGPEHRGMAASVMYSSNSEEFNARVLVLNGSNVHYFFTLIDQLKHEGSKAVDADELFMEILRGLQLSPGHGGSESVEKAQVGQIGQFWLSSMFWLVALGILVLALVIWRYRSNFSKSVGK